MRFYVSNMFDFLFRVDPDPCSGKWIDPAWLALDISRGIETKDSKVFMRATVLMCDTLIYVPALLYFVRTWLPNRSLKTQVRFCVIVRFKSLKSIVACCSNDSFDATWALID